MLNPARVSLAGFLIQDVRKGETMAFGFRLPWTRTAAPGPPEAKSCRAGAIAAFADGDGARWSGRSYAGLAREGFMRNPVAHRATRMIAEAAAPCPGWCSTAAASRSAIRCSTCSSPERAARAPASSRRSTAIWCCRAMPGSSRSLAARIAGLHLLRPDRMRVIEGPDGWPVAYDHQAGGRRGASRRARGGAAGCCT